VARFSVPITSSSTARPSSQPSPRWDSRESWPKRLASKYAGRRTPDWVKVKCDRRDLFVIGGATKPQGARTGFGALHVGRYDKGKLVYVTKVGTGFDDDALRTSARS
jgi:ATP-dependent DNA ligase